MRYMAMALLAAISIPADALWLEVTTLSAPSEAAGINVTFTAGDFLDNGRHGWLVGTYRAEGEQRLAVLRTTDGRRTWSAVWTGIDNTPATAVDFIDANRGWLVAGNRWVYRTEDGGRTWMQEHVHGPEPVLQDIAMVDATRGFIAGRVWRMERAAVFAYDAAERDWEQCLSLHAGLLHALAARSAGLIWAAGLSPEDVCIGYRLLGSAWLEMTIPSSVQALHFIDNRRGYAACTSGRVFDTSDGGTTWREKSTPVLCDLDDIHFPTIDHGLVLSSSGRLALVTKNRGDAWDVEQVPDGAMTLLWDGSKHLVLTSTGLYVREEIRRTVPLPELQRPQRLEPAQILPLPRRLTLAREWREATEISEAFPRSRMVAPSLTNVSGASFLDDNLHGWIIGWESRNVRAVLRTTNGGATWELLNRMGLPNVVDGVQFVDANNGWLWGGSPYILHTTDGGQTWEPERIEGSAASSVRLVNELSMFDARNGFAVADVQGSDEDLLLRRIAGSRSWEAVGPAPNFGKLATLPPDYFWLGSSTLTLRGGTSPDTLRPLMETRVHEFIRKLMLHSREVGWVLPTDATQIVRTTDGGSTWSWSRFASDAANYAIDAAIIGARECFILTRLGHVLYTGDGGQNWREVHRLRSDVEPYRGSIHTFGDHVYVCAGRELWTTLPARGPAEITSELQPVRPILATRLLSWSEQPQWAGTGVHPVPGVVGRESVFRVQWDRRNSRSPGNLMLQMRVPEVGLPLLATLKPARWWETHETGTGDWGVGVTPPVAGSYEYRFFGTNEDGEEVTGEPTEWRTWRVD